LLRAVLLYLSKAVWARSLVTGLPFARRAAARFVAGDTLEEALPVIQALNEKGLFATIDHLGENTSSIDEAQTAAEHYIHLLDDIARTDLKASVSLKLTQLGLKLDTSVCWKLLQDIVGTGAQHGIFVRIDMEDSGTVDTTLEFYRRLVQQGFTNTGVVIQSYLHRSREDVEALLGLVPAQVLDDFSQAILFEDIPTLINLVENIVNQGWSISQFISSLINHFRDLLVISLMEKASSVTKLGAANAEDLRERTEKFSSRRLLYILDELIELEKNIKYAVSERINLEMVLIKLARSKGMVYLDELISRLESMETDRDGVTSQGISNDKSASVVDNFVEEPATGPRKTVAEVWPEFLETLRGNRPMLRTYLTEGNPGEPEDGVITVYFPDEFDFNREQLERAANLRYLEKMLKNKLGKSVSLKFVCDHDRDIPPASPPPGPKKKK